jgi:hypothetical protein
MVLAGTITIIARGSMAMAADSTGITQFVAGGVWHSKLLTTDSRLAVADTSQFSGLSAIRIEPVWRRFQYINYLGVWIQVRSRAAAADGLRRRPWPDGVPIPTQQI